ncbi:hypothetical protein E3Q23_01737 [Wallemia mellicola]|uniref:Uncharacterized protein n=1 Tax=Wallemia mellicola TaxID=1708541 RepID=A0A4T0M236_9BASI|nr:hypothetical protein E3Q24_02024 [Wallemia mellicola]TIB76588.1 hypothetical protein E3Q23_01737 [Wallemia mellicola]TIB85247.1 hypothetical protein E3Q21_02057 [Wallemia mellicola]TIB88450.1 hypothetical protein E3Q20_02050 [Wallemia mellicola]TIC05486.1 hypothetical protein E3Q16_02082 [Wallemia mellicola]
MKGLREWLVTPSLRKYASVNQDKPTRSFKLTDSALAGAIGGGSWNYHLRGKAGVVPGILTAVVVCTAGQVAANEVRVQRIKYILRRKEREEQDKTKEVRVVERPLQPAPQEPPKHSWLDRFKFYRVPDEEYLNKLKDKSDQTKSSIMAIEQRMNELKLLLDEKHEV